jgi:hypothetical protein
MTKQTHHHLQGYQDPRQKENREDKTLAECCSQMSGKILSEQREHDFDTVLLLLLNLLFRVLDLLDIYSSVRVYYFKMPIVVGDDEQS